MSIDQFDTSYDSLATRESWLVSESFWLPGHVLLGENSAWTEHAPFAFWLVAALKPRTIVELGTHYGFSYFTFCGAIRRLGLPTRTWAVDTWAGDEHAGFYQDEVYDSVRGVNEEFSTFSTLLRGYFDDHVNSFEDGSIDLLHIDGRHRYEDVKHDFETWLPKVSSRGIVLFHDVAERRDDFGVWQFWEEVSKQYPSFAFEHEHGLGVLGVGSELPAVAGEFFAAAELHAEDIRGTYSTLGMRIGDLVSKYFGFFTLAQREAAALARAELAEAEIARLEAELNSVRMHAASELAAVHSTLSWRVTKPLRAVRHIGR